jgi:hypothetical protein
MNVNAKEIPVLCFGLQTASKNYLVPAVLLKNKSAIGASA